MSASPAQPTYNEVSAIPDPSSAPRSNVPAILSVFLLLTLSFLGWEWFTHVKGMVFAQDWMVYYTASEAALNSDYSLLADGFRLTNMLANTFQDALKFSINLHPWVYPPPFLLLIMPLSLLGHEASYVSFMLLSFACLLLAIHVWPASRSARAILMVSAVACPGTLFTLMAGQNAFLSAALLIGGLGLLDRRPVLGGALLGLLLCKPQLVVLIPVVLLAGRRWRALAAAFCSATALCLTTFAVFGPQIWTNWVGLMVGTTQEFMKWEHAGRDNGMSVFACARALSSSRLVATAAQDLSILIAVGVSAYLFATRQRHDVRVAATLIAVGLAAPHFSNYDMLIGCLGATLVWLHGLRHGFLPGEFSLTLLCWACPLAFSPTLTMVGALTPVFFIGLLGCLILRSGLGRSGRESDPAKFPSSARLI